jgi:hypothetical protein
MVSKTQVVYIASRKWSRRKADGTTVEWQQEDESIATSKADVIGMLQRTIDFWLPQLVQDLHEQTGVTLDTAKASSLANFRTSLSAMLDRPWTKRWGVTLKDFNFPTE